jgi:hypothetical protein
MVSYVLYIFAYLTLFNYDYNYIDMRRHIFFPMSDYFLAVLRIPLDSGMLVVCS